VNCPCVAEPLNGAFDESAAVLFAGMSDRRGERSPPFCPNPDCDSHTNPGPWRFKKKGFHRRARGPRRVQRYVCHHCRRNFSSQTFSPTYWLKRTDLLEPLFHRILGCSALRQIADTLRGAGI